MRVLLTGAAGSIGRVVTVGLADRGHRVIGLDRVVEPEGFDGPWHSVDCADPDAVASVFEAESPDAVVHLAGHPGEANLPDSLASHVVTTAALLDAMVEHDVQRIVYASSNHAVGRTPRPGDSSTQVSDDLRPRPDTFYGVGKVAAEALLSLYADRYAIDAVACRIGSFLPRPESTRNLSTWLSHDHPIRSRNHRARFVFAKQLLRQRTLSIGLSVPRNSTFSPLAVIFSDIGHAAFERRTTHSSKRLRSRLSPSAIRAVSIAPYPSMMPA